MPLTPAQRSFLVALRALTFIAALLLVLRPVVLLPPASAGQVVIPVLVDASRSMRVADADGSTRIDRARQMLTSTLIPELSKLGTVEVFRVGDALAEASPASLAADERRTDLSGAIASARERFRGSRVAGIVVLSDGADTGQGAGDVGTRPGAPVYAVGIGSPEGVPDREITGMTAGDPRIDQAMVDLHVTAVQSGFGRQPFTLRLIANGRLVESRRVTPLADGTPSDQTFTVLPDPLNATVYTAEIAGEGPESITENNVRSVLVRPAGRKRRILVLAGAPGYEHSFLARALSQDPGLEIDSVVRKGKDDLGRDTFLIQAGGGRGGMLTGGFPLKRDALFTYDAVIVGNVEGEFFSRDQLTMLADFVSVRGGGLVVLGGRTFLQRGIAGSAIEEALPLELNDRRGGAPARALDGEGSVPTHAVALTSEGASHPIMRIAGTQDETRKLWTSLPPLPSVAPVGGPRPGATVLAITTSPGVGQVPLVAVQRYGRGRSLVFSGEASWRWRMLRPSTDRSYELFWRQAVRWIAGDASDPVAFSISGGVAVGDGVAIELDARDAAYVPVGDATVEATLTAPGGQPAPLALRPSGLGKHAASFVSDTPGLYRVRAEARRGAALLGAADEWFQVGRQDPEFADPRLNEGFLRRVARQSGGEYVTAAEVGRVVSALSTAVPQTLEPERRDLWHEPRAFALVIVLLAAEWILRRRWGLR